MINGLQTATPLFHPMNCSVRKTLCRGDLFHNSALLPSLSNHRTQCSLPLSSFDHAEIVCSSLSLLSLFFFQSFSMPTVLSWTLVTWRKRKSTMGLICQTRDAEMCAESVANNVQSEIIKLPVRLWLIFTNIWQGGFVLWICFGFRFWCLSRP